MECCGTKQKQPDMRYGIRAVCFLVLAATYSPALSGSTIGAGELNYSVRNGKR
ncbi:MAG: hypothetical protein RLZZ248_1234, partial [Bacteroidota bacterium]